MHYEYIDTATRQIRTQSLQLHTAHRKSYYIQYEGPKASLQRQQKRQDIWSMFGFSRLFWRRCHAYTSGRIGAHFYECRDGHISLLCRSIGNAREARKLVEFKLLRVLIGDNVSQLTVVVYCSGE